MVLTQGVLCQLTDTETSILPFQCVSTAFLPIRCVVTMATKQWRMGAKKWLGEAYDTLTLAFWGYPIVSVVFNTITAYLVCLIVLDSNQVENISPSACPYACVLIFNGGAQDAHALIGLVSGTAISIATLTFSLTVLSLQMAAVNYTPRLLDEFLRDPVAKLALSTYLGAFCYCYIVTQNVSEYFIPHVALSLLVVYAFAVVVAFIVFVQHFVHVLRLETILNKGVESAIKAAEHFPTTAELERKGSSELIDGKAMPTVPAGAMRVRATSSGYIQSWRLETVSEDLVFLKCCVRYACRIGEFVAKDTLLAWVWAQEGTFEDLSARIEQWAGEGEKPNAVISRIVNEGCHLGSARAGTFDVAMGVRQISDIAVRVLSPGINDPHSANQSMDALSKVFSKLSHIALTDEVCYDESNTPVIMAPGRTFEYLLSISMDPIRTYGAGDLRVVRRAMMFLADVGSICSDLGQHARVKVVVCQLNEWVAVVENKFGKESREAKKIAKIYKQAKEMISGGAFVQKLKGGEEEERMDDSKVDQAAEN